MKQSKFDSRQLLFFRLPVGLYHLKNLSTTDTDRFEQEIKAIKSTRNLVKFSSTQMKAVMETIPNEEVLINLNHEIFLALK